jgi:cysteine desulfurase/selenocysteine lyase
MATATATPTAPTFNADAVRADFPILARSVHGKPLVYLDNAATSQKPEAVLKTLDDYYRRTNANVHRGLHALSQQATDAYEQARHRCAQFVHAATPGEIVFTRGATEAINLVAHSFGQLLDLQPGDRVLITQMEHHSNIVPWQLLCQRTGAELVYIPIDDRGQLELDTLGDLIDERVKLASFVWISNSLGTINPVKRLTAAVQAVGGAVMIDACQAAPHTPIDVQDLGCDFLAVSGHKMFAPTGIGFLWAKADHLAAMPPYQGGGEMIDQVTLPTGTSFAEPPMRFEAGTPDIAGAIGLGAAIDYMQHIDWDAAVAHEHALLARGTALLQDIDGLRLIGTADEKAAILSFTIDGVHAYDIGPVLDRFGVAVRTGHHCCQPVMDRFNIPATVRASLSIYNTPNDLDTLAEALTQAMEFFI